jgi:hypothetical protein
MVYLRYRQKKERLKLTLICALKGTFFNQFNLTVLKSMG